MPNTNQKTHATPHTFLNYARQYHQAAEELAESKLLPRQRAFVESVSVSARQRAAGPRELLVKLVDCRDLATRVHACSGGLFANEMGDYA